MSNTKILTYTFGVIILFFIYSSFFTVDQTKQAIVLQFGEPKRVVNKPGLNFKIPFIQDVTYFEKRVLSLVSSDSEEVILSDQKRLEVDTYSRFKIENKKFLPIEVNGLKTMSIGYLIPEEMPNIWRGPMVIKAITQLLKDVVWGDLDILIIDTPPGTGDIQLTISQKIDVSGALIITTPQELSLLDVRRGINMFKKVNLPILGLIENMSYYICNECEKKHYIFGEKSSFKLANKFDLEILGELPLSKDLVKKYNIQHPIIKQKKDDVIFKSFFDISQKILKKIKT